MGVYGISFSFLFLFLFASVDLRISGPSQCNGDQVDGGATLRRFFSVIFCIGFVLLVSMAKGSGLQTGSTRGASSNGPPHVTDGTGTLY